ncbi:MAG: FAD-binding oxidoreductase [Bdellovibrionales bacterium CG10_big_fil_rev_8_21_14_0_10_45_34]|nr:MAG: FAD-binding oxidoreductase [Bdellovibrionales bacterium CG10_big_fil_rev_8_21_14_0_10_45_34]
MKLLDSLANILSKNQISIDKEELLHYGRDWTRHETPAPLAVVFPKSTKDVMAIVQWANENDVSIVPSGGRTGLSAGAVAANQELVLSLEKMNAIHEFDQVDQTLRCDAGVVLQEIQNFARQKNLFYPVDFAAKGSSQIGGNVSTNAGGIKVIRYGMTRNWVAGLTCVTGGGEVLELGKSLVKDATGYDLKDLVIGSEGTLAIVTEVTVQLTKPPRASEVFLLQVASLDGISKVLETARQLQLTAFEFFSEQALELVLKSRNLEHPLSGLVGSYYVVCEFETEDGSSLDHASQILVDLIEAGVVVNGALSQNSEQKDLFWSYRESISESLAPFMPYKNDISVKRSLLAPFLRETQQVIENMYPHWKVIWFGHVGDGNLHINILKPQELDVSEFRNQCKKVDEALFHLVEKFNGSISAEHGVGTVKKAFLKHSRTEAEILIMRQIKKAFDPNGILNPGKIFD